MLFERSFQRHQSSASALFLLLTLSSWTIVHTSPLNIALNKPITAEVTCGQSGDEFYYTHSQIYLRPSARTTSTCTAQLHPPSAMVDELSTTWWQSTSRDNLISAGYGLSESSPQAVITLDLLKESNVQQVILQMGDSKRPGSMALFKSTDGAFYEPWVYRVPDNAEHTCNDLFGTPILYSPQSIGSVVCQGFSDAPANQQEKIIFDFTTIDANLLAWRNLRYLRVQFYNMELTLGINGGQFQHFTVQSLQVLAECSCNAHSIGCEKNSQTGRYQCVCTDNTEGEFCERCQPFYNQKEYHTEKPCEACNCHGQATSCYYDPMTDLLGRSLNAQGVREGGGVCIDCQRNTTGANCEQCMSFFYQLAAPSAGSSELCLPCDCHMPGVQTNPETGLVGDCLNGYSSLVPTGMQAGDCFCKWNVIGSKCDQCRPGFFNLAADNPIGCELCLCNALGTINSSVECDAITGQCPCKSHVSGRRCDVCEDGSYSLDSNGCIPCDCDVGGAVDNVCDKTSGQCLCRAGIQGRTCNKPIDRYYYPELFYINSDFENRLTFDGLQTLTAGYKGFGYFLMTPTTPASTVLYIPAIRKLSGKFSLLLRYRADRKATGTINGIPIGPQKQLNVPITFDECANKWCHLLVDGDTSLPAGGYTISVSSDSPVSLDQVIALPVEFSNTSTLLGPAKAQSFQQNCDILNNDMKLNTSVSEVCLSAVFSLTSFYLDGTRPCDSNPLGSYLNVSCDPYGGQSLCKPGVGLQACSQCLPGFYRLNSAGCMPCECAGEKKFCNQGSGDCECPPHTVGRACDICENEYWGLNSSLGCQPCQCDSSGARSTSCNSTTGQCICALGVGNLDCSGCLDGFYNFSPGGCQPCDCNEGGSVSAACDQVSGDCVCKPNAMGPKCDSCKPGSFYNAPSHPNGCLQCVCMGITQECTSLLWRYQRVAMTTANRMTVRTEAAPRTDINVTIATVDGNIGMSRAFIPQTTDTLYWEFAGFSGNRLHSYGGKILFDLHFASLNTYMPLTPLPTPPGVILVGQGGVMLRFEIASFNQSEVVSVELTLTETNVNGGLMKRPDFLLALTDVQKILLPASFASETHVSSIGNLAVDVASSEEFYGDLALGVEKCSCGEGYEGLSCETCSAGYKRGAKNVYPSFFGGCVACECNNHSNECNVTTGECHDCQHNTTGASCEKCEVNFYGDATKKTPDDCHLCPCLEPRVVTKSCKVVKGQPQCQCNTGYVGRLCDSCANNYYGEPWIEYNGTCKACECNGNANKCDKITGDCINCKYGTVGRQCERCADYTYGIAAKAAKKRCKPCSCLKGGSNGTLCDHVTGKCPCYPGVGGRVCNGCMKNYYGFGDTSFSGCKSCDCNPYGSESAQCDQKGKCKCVRYVDTKSPKCDRCMPRYYGLPNLGCALCLCDSVGSVDFTEPCEIVTGQCKCRPGITDRSCSRCKRMHFDFSKTGCKACPVCPTSLSNDMIQISDDWLKTYITADDLVNLQSVDKELQEVTSDLNETITSLGGSNGYLRPLDTRLLDMERMQPELLMSLDTLGNQLSVLFERTAEMLNETTLQLSRLRKLKELANNIADHLLMTNSSAKSIASLLTEFNQSAHQLLSLGNEISPEITSSFQRHRDWAVNELTDILATSAAVSRQLAQLNSQANETDALWGKTEDEERRLTDSSQQVDGLNRKVTELQGRTALIWRNLNTAQEQVEYAGRQVSDIRNMLNTVDSSLHNTSDIYKATQQLLADCVTIIEGNPHGNLPINDSSQVSEITSWTSGANQLSNSLVKLGDKLVNRIPFVQQTEARAPQLSQQAAALQQEFKRVEPIGQNAVNAIANYESVVSTLQASLQMALEANKTMTAAMKSIEGISLQILQSEASSSVNKSSQLLSDVRHKQTDVSALNVHLEKAKASLNAADVMWSQIANQQVALNAAASTAQMLTPDSALQEEIRIRGALAENLLRNVQNTLTQDNEMRPLVDQQETSVTELQEKVTNASDWLVEIPEKVTSFRKRLNDKVQPEVDHASAQVISGQRADLDTRIAAIEAKVQQADKLLLALQQPVRFTASQHVSLLTSDSSHMLHSEISLRFAYADRAEGLLVFVDNTETRERILLQLIGGHVVYEYANVDVTVTARSAAELCRNCWFHVIATRYGTEGQLTVTSMATGGVATNHLTASSTLHDRVTLTSSIFIAGLPTDYQTTKVYKPIDFIGCIDAVYYNGDLLPVWQTLLGVNTKAQCCQRPPKAVVPPTIEGVGFDGFGFLRLSLGSMSIAHFSKVSLQFRTFSKSAVMLLVDRQNNIQYYGIFLNNGKVVFEIRSQFRLLSIESSRTYNDGEWYQVDVGHDSSSFQLAIKYVNQSMDATVDVHTRTNPEMNFVDLAQGQLTFGAQNPHTTRSRGPVNAAFSGCMRYFQYSRDSSSPMIRRKLNVGAESYEHVDLEKCYQKVVSGIGFRSPGAYAKFLLPSSQISTVRFELSTYQPHGLLLYAELQPNPPDTYLYVTLYHGDIFVMFNQGQGSQPPLRTRGLHLNDGAMHKVMLDFQFRNSPQLSVDSEVHYGAMLLQPAMKLKDSTLYVGGLPTTLTFNSDLLPVRQSLASGIRQLFINDRIVELGSIVKENQNGIYLSGISAPPLSIPPLPYSTTRAPPTTPAPTCAIPPELRVSVDGVKFGGIFSESFMSFDIDKHRHIFQNAFSIKLEFRALQPTGLLLYMADSSASNPSFYFAIYLHNGFVTMSMQSDSLLSRKQPSRTKNIKLRFRYDDGHWWKIEALRINDFLALIATDRKDYKNNGVKSTDRSELSVLTDFYIGGVPNSLKGLPFGSSNDIAIAPVPFHGCIRQVEAVTHDFRYVRFNLTEPRQATGTGKCYENTTPGVYLKTSTSYVRVNSPTMSTFDLQVGFTFNVTFRSESRDGILMVLWKHSAAFLLLQINAGQIQLVVANGNDVSSPMVVMTTSGLADSYTVCDNNAHSVSVRVLAKAVSLNINNHGVDERPYPTGFKLPVTTEMALYAGGIRQQSWNLPQPAIKSSLIGCILSVAVNGRNFALTESFDINSVIAGCPSTS